MKQSAALSLVLALFAAGPVLTYAQSGGMKGMDMKGSDMKGMDMRGKGSMSQSTITLTKGQVLRIAPDGKVSVAQMNMEGKMQEEMKKQAQPVTKGLVVWLDQNGQLSYLTNPVDTSWVTGAPMNQMKK